MAELPHCDELFLRLFDPWYDEGDRQRRGFLATRPDLSQSDDLVGVSQADASPLTEDGQSEVLQQIDGMVNAARGDWPQFLQVRGDVDLNWIAAFDRHFDESRIQEVIDSSQPADFNNAYVVLCCEFGAALSQVMGRMQPRLVWHLEWPYWEWALLDPQTGNLMPVFHWAIKKMSGYGWNDGFAQKVQACLQLLDGKQASGW